MIINYNSNCYLKLLKSWHESQKITGFNVGIGNTVIKTFPGTLVHTCPAGKIQQIHVVINIRKLTSTQNIRLRIAGLLVRQWGEDDPTVCASCVVPPQVAFDAGVFTLRAGEEVRINAQTMAFEDGECSCLVSILAETPQ